MSDKKILILTQRVDRADALCGFFHDWLLEFARQCGRVEVICLEAGDYDLPPNVRVWSLGKERLAGRPRAVKLVLYLWRFYAHLWRLRGSYGAVLAHMNHEYAILGAPFWRGKRVGLWYVHKHVSPTLRLAEKLVDVVFTATPDGFRVPSRKVKVVGHGVDEGKYQEAGKYQESSIKYQGAEKYQVSSIKYQGDTGPELRSDHFRIVYVGRISKIKNQRLLLGALDILVNREKMSNIRLDLVGGPVYDEDRAYEAELKDFAREKGLTGQVRFRGNIPHTGIAGVYADADLSVNLCPTGGADKAVIESMLAGLPVIALNRTFVPILGTAPYLLEHDDPALLAEHIMTIVAMSPEARSAVGQRFSGLAAQQHGLKRLIGTFVNDLINVN